MLDTHVRTTAHKGQLAETGTRDISAGDLRGRASYAAFLDGHA